MNNKYFLMYSKMYNKIFKLLPYLESLDNTSEVPIGFLCVFIRFKCNIPRGIVNKFTRNYLRALVTFEHRL